MLKKHNSDRRVTFEEQKQIQLEILKEVDSFCREKNLRYFLGYGTLLGAIRHKGYIPWDDDLDIVMPYPDAEVFKKEYRSEKYKFCDIDTEKHYEFSFPRMCYLPTYNKVGRCGRTYGVNIDIYTMLGLPSDPKEIERFNKKNNKIRKIRVRYIKWRLRIMRRFPIDNIPGFDYWMKKYKNNRTQYPYENSRYFFSATDPILKYTDIDFFENLIDVDFEGYKFKAPARYHEYLTMKYGNYMELPPEDKRHPYHGSNFYWKNSSEKA